MQGWRVKVLGDCLWLWEGQRSLKLRCLLMPGLAGDLRCPHAPLPAGSATAQARHGPDGQQPGRGSAAGREQPLGSPSAKWAPRSPADGSLCFHPLFSLPNCGVWVSEMTQAREPGGMVLESICQWVSGWLCLCGLPQLSPVSWPSLVPLASVTALFTVSLSLYLSQLSFSSLSPWVSASLCADLLTLRSSRKEPVAWNSPNSIPLMGHMWQVSWGWLRTLPHGSLELEEGPKNSNGPPVHSPPRGRGASAPGFESPDSALLSLMTTPRQHPHIQGHFSGQGSGSQFPFLPSEWAVEADGSHTWKGSER